MVNALPEWAEWLPWAAAALAVAWVLLPKLLALLGQTRCAIAIVGGPETLTPTDDEPYYAHLFLTLHDLGFEPLGSHVESSWFSTLGWHRSALPGRIFGTNNRECFASLYRLYHGDPWRVAFCTVFTDDFLVMTANQMANFRIEQEGYFRWAYSSSDLAEVLRRHYLAVEDHRAADGRTVDTPGLEEICEAVRYHSERFVRNRGPALVLKSLPNTLMLLITPPFLIGGYLGFRHWAVPLGFVVGAACYAAFVPYALRKGTRIFRDQDRQQARAARRVGAKPRKHTRRGGDEPLLPEAPRLPSSEAITPAERPAGSDDRFTGGE